MTFEAVFVLKRFMHSDHFRIFTMTDGAGIGGNLQGQKHTRCGEKKVLDANVHANRIPERLREKNDLNHTRPDICRAVLLSEQCSVNIDIPSAVAALVVRTGQLRSILRKIQLIRFGLEIPIFLR